MRNIKLSQLSEALRAKIKQELAAIKPYISRIERGVGDNAHWVVLDAEEKESKRFYDGDFGGTQKAFNVAQTYLDNNYSLLKRAEKIAEAAQPHFLKDKQAVEAWLASMGIDNYTISDDLVVDVKGDVDISGKGLTALPIQFRKVEGKFDCSNNKLKQLIGAPKSVVEFDCSDNDLFNLLFSPKEAEVFKCSNNRILSFEGIPAKLKELHCEKNRIKSLKGLPEILGGVLVADCRIAYNEIKDKTGVEFLTLISDKEALNN